MSKAQSLVFMDIPFSKIEAILFDLDGTLVDTDDVAMAKLAGQLRPLFQNNAPKIARWLWMEAETPGNALITLLDWLHLDRFVFDLRDRLFGREADIEFQFIHIKPLPLVVVQ